MLQAAASHRVFPNTQHDTYLLDLLCGLVVVQGKFDVLYCHVTEVTTNAVAAAAAVSCHSVTQQLLA